MLTYAVLLERPPRKKSIGIDDVDFQLDLLHSDRINVGYIINLLQLVVDTDSEDKRQKYQAQIYDLISSDISLHDKQDLIQKFIEENIPKMINGQSVQDAFAHFGISKRTGLPAAL